MTTTSPPPTPAATSALERFHPAVARWFTRALGSPTDAQARGWASIQARRNTLIAAPTGSGKTLAAFLAAIDDLVRTGIAAGGTLPDETRVVYVSPLKALSNDIQRNLEAPLAAIEEELSALGLPQVAIRTFVRTGDTTARARAAAVERPPHLFVTTPESLYILLTSERGRKMLRTTRTVIVDEIHALVRDKRGSHLALSLERLAALAPGGMRIGLSATQRPIEEVARFLTGAGLDADGQPDCEIIDTGHARALDLGIEVPASPLQAVMAGEVWQEVYDRLAALINQHRTTLVFVNTRRLAERVTRHLSERIGAENITSHHGSLAREQRHAAEQQLKNGELRALVATSSLELGIDIGAVDLVCQIGSTRSIATLLQRVGRSGHFLGGLPRGRLFPTSRDELVECAALLDAVRRRELDRVSIPEQPLDILAQQVVAAVACEEWGEDDLFALVRGAYPYRNLERRDFDRVIEMLAEGFTTRRGRRGAYLHRDQVHGRLRGRRGARLSAITSGGAIPDNADYEVLLEPTGILVGTVNEDFAIESMAGDIFQLGNASWRIQRIEPGRVRVEDAKGQPPTIPFWFGEAPARSRELSTAVSRLRTQVVAEPDRSAGASWLAAEVGVAAPAAEQIAEYLFAGAAALGVMPSQETLVAERFFDESGGMQLVLHAPFGSRLNRALGLALRKRFCQRFNFELQAAATEDAIVLSLGPTHSFPLESVFHFLHSNTVRDVLTQALLDAPMFATRWRWNTTRALAVLRWRGGRKVPPRFQRMDADDLLTLVFPDQVACAENVPGKREIPDHPLVEQTVRDCLVEAMDIDALEDLLRSIERGERRLVARDLTEPSPLAQEILSARPYAFLDDAPLEERRTQAVMSRRWLDPETAADLGRLDPDAIARVRDEAWPDAENADEMHDALMLLGYMTAEEGERGEGWPALLAELAARGRATTVATAGSSLWVAAERLPLIAAIHPQATLIPAIAAPAALANEEWTPERALVELLRGRLEALGPVTAAALATSLSVEVRAVEGALIALETEGFALRGQFTAEASNGAATAGEWCERRLLARIHRYTLHRLRSEIEPVPVADFMRFLLLWQRVDPEHRVSGPEALAALLEQLEGYEAPAQAWEADILPSRMEEYDPAWLDALCLAGKVAWMRLRPPVLDQRSDVSQGTNGRARRRAGRLPGPVRATPIVLLEREHLDAWRSSSAVANGDAPAAPVLSPPARLVREALAARGASFFAELVRATGLLRTHVEAALAELVAMGLATADSYTGLRALLTPSNRRPPLGERGYASSRRGRAAIFGMESAGRWTLLGEPPAATASATTDAVETVARVLLRRYGVVFKRVLARESNLPPWRELLRMLRRLEARGEIRGGRFVAGVAGEQFALPDAVGMLRDARRKGGHGTLVSVSAADPLNLAGILLPGERVPALTGNRILFRDGVAIGTRVGGETRLALTESDAPLHHDAESALLRRRVAPRLRAYLGH